MAYKPSKRYSGMKVNPHKNDHSKKPLKKPKISELRIQHERRDSGRKAIRQVITEKEYVYLRFYELLITYHSLRLNIEKNQLRVLFFFYDGYAFKREDFRRYANAISSKGISLSLLINKGYIKQFEKKYITERDLVNKKTIKVPFYAVTKQVAVTIMCFYRELNKIIELDSISPETPMSMSEEVARIYNSYIRKINNFKKGLGQVEEIVVDREIKVKKPRTKKTV